MADVLLAAAQAVQAVRAGASLTDALAQVPVGLRPATQAISFHAMRRLGTAMAVRARLIPRKPPSALLEALLLVAFSLLDGSADERGAAPQGDSADSSRSRGASYAAHTVVDQAVRAVSGHRKLAAFKGLVNGALRRFVRERDEVLAAVAGSPESQWNYPAWWVAQLGHDYPQDWQAILTAGNVQGPLTLRVNRRRASRGQVQAELAAAGAMATPVGEHGLLLAHARPVQQLPGFEAGWWSVQDLGAQMAAPLLAVRDGMRVLDACAAPGGKTAHLLEMANIDLLALDSDAGRLERVRGNLDRLGLQAQLQAADAADLEAWWDGRPFDAVLADVPCTASGIVRRHPDIRWLRRANDVDHTAALQARLADSLWQVVAPGGTLLYATCSVFPAEGEHQAAAFASRHPDARRLPSPGQLLPAGPDAIPTAQHDGFFYALFTKV
nr:16S rRNA (cytosine(967)-C(5))-methyltransferase RsmB [Pseudomonas sp.]